jgi:hypothetical protein
MPYTAHEPGPASQMKKAWLNNSQIQKKPDKTYIQEKTMTGRYRGTLPEILHFRFHLQFDQHPDLTLRYGSYQFAHLHKACEPKQRC